MFARALGRRLALVTRRFPVLGIRDFRLLLADRVLAPASFAFSLVGVSFAVLDATHSTADLASVNVARTAPALVFVLAVTIAVDRFCAIKNVANTPNPILCKPRLSTVIKEPGNFQVGFITLIINADEA